MSFPDPSPFMMPPQPFDIGGDGYWSQFSVTNDQFDSQSQYDSPNPPAKRPRNSEDSQSNSGSLQSANNRSNPPVNRGTTNIFFKTRMCAKFRMGTCRNGENCNFAHGMEDMRQPPPNWQELVGVREREDDHRSSENWDDDQKIIHKMKLCKKFYNGEECPYGNRCNFLHEDPAKFRDDSGKFRESTAICIGPTPIVPANGSNQSEGSRSANGSGDARANAKPVYWKTKLCTKFETTGQCPFGDKCHFAHGLAELQGPVGRAEGETTNIPSVSVKPLPLPINDASPAQIVNIPTLAEDGQGKKCFLKWKGTKKINQIYADWLDDLPLVQNLPNKVEG